MSKNKKWDLSVNKSLRIVDKILTRANIVVEAHLCNEEEYPLFGFSREYSGDFSDMLRYTMYNGDVLRFLKMLLTDFPWTRNDTLKLPDNIEMSQFLHYFISDIKMSLLKDACINLSEYFVKNYNSKANLKIMDELFYSPDFFDKKVKEFALATKFTNISGLNSVLEDYKGKIHLKVPKICFPWYIYALCRTFEDFPSRRSKKRFTIVDGNRLSLNWSGRNEMPSDSNYIEEQQRKLGSFLDSLRIGDDSQGDNEYNRSLNLYLFDETTNLYDIFYKLNSFQKGSSYMTTQLIRMETGVDSMAKEVKVRHERLKKTLNGVCNIAQISNFGVKIVLNDYYEEHLFKDARTWPLFNKIFCSCKNYLLQIMEKHHFSNDHDLPKEIRLDYSVYTLLSTEDPYISLLNAPYKPYDYSVHIDPEDPPEYVPSSDEINRHINAAFFYLCKYYYEVQYKGTKKRIKY